MAKADYRGARGSNAGDNFHELWALRQALTLLNADTGLTSITLEGLAETDEKGTSIDSWDGVDCTLYYGGIDADSSDRIEVAQLKYSAANPGQAWSTARLTRSTNRQKDNSVLGRLGKAFLALRTHRPQLIEKDKVKLRLISNQPIDQAVRDALLGDASGIIETTAERRKRLSARTKCRSASKLSLKDFNEFTKALDFSQCGHESRFATEERILTIISKWTDDDARADINHLLMFVRRAMLPEAKREPITSQTILALLGFSDARALFPCPPALKRVEQLIPRKVSQTVTARLLSGTQRICLHGEGGCGKTTALQEIKTLLPSQSVLIVFDCYGGGRYLDADAYRHRPQDAFLQLANDLASNIRIPLLVSRDRDLDYPRKFKQRLNKAAEAVAALDTASLLVIAVDAADNSVTAAGTRSPPEPSFLHDFVRLGDLPKNVRFLVTARTARLLSLKLPREWAELPIEGFSREETELHVKGFTPSAPSDWIDDFHRLSNGNPRVQRYALDYASPEVSRALDYLRPNGKGIDEVFREQLRHALNKQGDDLSIKPLCAGLVALPRPVPIADLSAVAGLSAPQIRDLCADFSPGMRIWEESISFADEDFEHFVRIEGETSLGQIQTRIADHFLMHHKTNAYAAAHIAEALFSAGRGRALIDLINAEREPSAIGDLVLRKEAQLKRLRIAMKVCRESGDNVDALLTLLRGAEALKSDSTIRRSLTENPDLAAHFARDTATRFILRDAKQLEKHGPLLFHLMASDARHMDAVSVRENHRQINAWMRRRTEHAEEQEARHPNIRRDWWPIKFSDIAASVEAVLRVAGPKQAVENLLRWRPRSIAAHVAMALSSSLIISGKEALVEQCLAEAEIPQPWNLLLLMPLALAQGKADLPRIADGVAILLRRGLIRLAKLKEPSRDDETLVAFLDMVMTACEAIVAQGSNVDRIIPVLHRFAAPELRRRDQLYTFNVSFIDLSLRAHTLIERLANRTPTLESYWEDPLPAKEEVPDDEVKRLRRADVEKKEELAGFIGPLLGIYDARAKVIVNAMPMESADAEFQRVIAHLRDNDYQFGRKLSASDMRARVSLSIARLMVLSGLSRPLLMEWASSVLGTRPDWSGAGELQVLSCFALDGSLHDVILRMVTDQARAIRCAKVSAEEKVSVLLRFARFLMPLSYDDAKSLFKEAIDASSGVDLEAIHEIQLFQPLTQHAVAAMNLDERRDLARDLAIIVGDAGVRLSDQREFPWESVASALTTLDINLALAAAGRWEDLSIVDRMTFLPYLLKAALSAHALAPAQVTALSVFLESLDAEQIIRIVASINAQTEALNVNALAEELARDELLRFGHGKRSEVCKALQSLAQKSSSGFWMERLAQATAFHHREKSRDSAPGIQNSARFEDPKVKTAILEGIAWSREHFLSAQCLADLLKRVQAAAREAEGYVDTSEILDWIRIKVLPSDRVAHLEALSALPSAFDYEVGDALVRCLHQWQELPAVGRWCRERILEIVKSQLPRLSRWLGYNRSPLPMLLRKSAAPDYEVCVALLEGIERHVDSLNAATVCALVGEISQFCATADVAKVAQRFASRLVQRILPAERDVWNLADIPSEPAQSLARLLYAFMSDIDVRIRWQSAHAVRRLVRLGEHGVPRELIELYERTSEQSFRAPAVPFYWLAARLWLVISLDRIARETPSTVVACSQRMLSIATDERFPHLLVRAFAKSGIISLVERGQLTLSSAQQDSLARVNESSIRRKKPPKRHHYGFGADTWHENDGRRFKFDSLDTLPYWYERALSVFADASGERFLDSAERWIIERWSQNDGTALQSKDPRQHRFSERWYALASHRHGSLPTLERFHTYLEWHAMWCAAGELMQTCALTKVDKDDYYSFDSWLDRKGVTEPSIWLADLLSLTPLEDRFWFPPAGELDIWVEEASEKDFLTEVGLVDPEQCLTIGSSHETRSRKFTISTTVQTALVSPSTASALVRALQTADDSSSFRIPPAGDHLEIDAPPYRLLGWLLDHERDPGIDELDPQRHEVGAIHCRPSAKTMEALGLEFICDGQAAWVQADSKAVGFRYESWGDRVDEDRERRSYDDSIRSTGWRLRTTRAALMDFLNHVGMELIVEVGIERRLGGYEDYSRTDKEKTKVAQFDKIILFRRDGTVEDAEGCIGTWASTCP